VPMVLDLDGNIPQCLIKIPESADETARQSDDELFEPSDGIEADDGNDRLENTNLLQRTTYCCKRCRKQFSRRENCRLHAVICKAKRSGKNTYGRYKKAKSPPLTRKTTRRALRKTATEVTLEPISTDCSHGDFEAQLLGYKDDIVSLVVDRLKERGPQRFYFFVTAEFSQTVDRRIITDPAPSFRVRDTAQIVAPESVEVEVNRQMLEILEQIDQYERNGSGWIFDRIVHLRLSMCDFRPLRGACCVKIPPTLAKRKAIVNIQNKDNQCFEYSCLAALVPRGTKVQNNPKWYINQLGKTFNMEGLPQPMAVTNIPNFEAQNEHVSVNVFGYEGGTIVPVYLSHNTATENVVDIDLLLLRNENFSHFACIRNLSRLVGSQISRKKNAKHICRRCLNPFGSIKILDDHKRSCDRYKMQVCSDDIIRKCNYHFCKRTLRCHLFAFTKLSTAKRTFLLVYRTTPDMLSQSWLAWPRAPL
jgi:hypothetical protein